MKLSTVATSVGKGLLAGLFGTAVMTLAQSLEMSLTGRKPSSTPAQAVEKILHVDIPDDKKLLVSNLVHWTYGTAWGGLRGLMECAGLDSTVHFGAVWGSSMVMLPTLGLAEPPTRWGKDKLAIDALEHAIYSAATGAMYRLLNHVPAPDIHLLAPERQEVPYPDLRHKDGQAPMAESDLSRAEVLTLM